VSTTRPGARAAAQFGMALAKRLDSQIVLVHAVWLPSRIPQGQEPPTTANALRWSDGARYAVVAEKSAALGSVSSGDARVMSGGDRGGRGSD
jgi:hypothetical protein